MDQKTLLKHFKTASWKTREEMNVFLYLLPPEALTERVVAEMADLLVTARAAGKLNEHKLRCALFQEVASKVHSRALFMPYVKALKKGDHNVRLVVGPLMRQVSNPQELGALCDLLGDQDADVRRAAGQALESLDTAAILPLLEKAVQGKNFAGRTEAAHVAVKVGGAKAIGVLEAVVAKGVSLERARALRLLAEEPRMREAGRRALKVIDPALGDKDPRVVSQAISAYGSLCDEQDYFDQIGPFLRASNTDLVRSAVRALRRFSSPVAMAALSRRLHAGPNVVRMDVLDVLEAIGHDEVLGPLVEALEHKDAAVRTRGGEVLGQLSKAGKLDVPRVIIWLLRSSNVNVRRMAVDIARSVEDPNAELWPKLFDYLCDEDWWVRERVKDSLVAMAGNQLTPFMGRFLKHKQKVMRRFGVEVLAQLKDPRALGALVAASREDEDWWTRERSIEAIGEMGDKRAVPYLIDIMSRDEEVQLVCIKALMELEGKAAAPHIANLLTSRDSDVRFAALEALDKLQTVELVDSVRPLLADSEAKVVRRAKEVLLHWNVALAGNDSIALQKSISMLDRLLVKMDEEGADDLIVASGRRPFVKKLGQMVPLSQTEFSAKEVAGMLTPHLSLAQLEDLKQLRDVDLSHEVKAANLRFRANIFQQRSGLSAVFRCIKADLPELEKLGLPEVVPSLGNLRHGLVLVGGPTGSGKSTTLAALIDYINRTSRRHVISFEDPIEVVHASKSSLVNQRELGTHTSSFNSALRSTLRQDPDVLLVGEMRDLDTISFALTAADTGHLVFGTVHTSSADATVDRLINAFPSEGQDQARFSLSESLRAVVCQYLIKRCDGPGRTLAVEVLINNDAVANLVRKGKTHQITSVVATSREQGMQLMDNELMRLYRAGIISLEDAHLRAVDKSPFEQDQDDDSEDGDGKDSDSKEPAQHNVGSTVPHRAA